MGQRVNSRFVKFLVSLRQKIVITYYIFNGENFCDRLPVERELISHLLREGTRCLFNDIDES